MRRLSIIEIDLFTEYLDMKIKNLEDIAKLNNNLNAGIKGMITGIKAVKLDLKIEKERRLRPYNG